MSFLHALHTTPFSMISTALYSYFSFVKEYVEGKPDWVVKDDLLSRFSRGLYSDQLQNKKSKHVTSARVYLSCFYFLSLFAQSPTGYLWLYCTLRRFKSFLVCHNKVLMFPSRKSSCKKSMVNKLLCKISVLIEFRLIVAQLILSWWYSLMTMQIIDGYDNKFVYIIA